MARIRVVNESEVIGRLRGITKDVERTQIYRLNQAIEPAWELSRKLVPYRTGFLHDSIYTEVDAKRAKLIASAPYAGYVEFGTRKMAARPYLRPAAKLMQTHGVTIVANDIKKRVNKRHG